MPDINEGFYRSLYENDHFIMLIIDPFTGSIVDSNPGASTFYGWSREQLGEMKIWDLNILSAQEVLEEMRLARMQLKKNFNFQHRRSNGEICNVEVCSSPITINNQTLLYSIVKDVTERKVAEDAQKHHKQFERTILHLAQNFINMPLDDLDDAVNAALARVVDYCDARRATFWKYDWERRISVKLYEHDKKPAAGIQLDDIPLTKFVDMIECLKRGEVSLINYDEDEKYRQLFIETKIQSTLTIPLLVDGNLIGTLTISSDSERKQWEETEIDTARIFAQMLTSVLQRKENALALCDSMETNRLILDSTSEGIAMLDREGNLLSINKMFAARYCATAEYCIGKNIKEFLPEQHFGDLCEKRMERFQKVFDTGQIELFEDSRGGLWFDNRVYPVFKDGRVVAVTLFSTDITAKIKAEEEARRNAILLREAQLLREKEQEYFEILDGSTEGSWIYDIKNNTMEYSPQWIKRIGAESIPSKDLFVYAESLLHPDDRERVNCVMKDSILKIGVKQSIEYRIKTVDSGYVWILSQWKLMCDANGTPEKIYGTLMEVDGRKQSEAMVLRQNAILQTLNYFYEKAVSCESMNEFGRACLDKIESVTQSKLSFAVVMGTDGLSNTAFSNTGWGLCKLGNKAGHQRLQGIFISKGLYSSVIQKGISLLTNDPCAHPHSTGVPKGHPKLTAFLGVPFIHNGKPVGMVGVGNREGGYRSEDQELLEALAPAILEVINRKRAEEALHASEALLRTIIEGTTDPIYLKDRQSKMLIANSATGRMIGMPVTEIMGKTSLDYLQNSEEAKIITANDKRIMDAGRAEVLEEVITSASCSKTYQMTKAPWHDSDGSVIGIIVVARDITERKAMEDELKGHVEELAKKNKLITDLFTNISHEFKTPLTVILLQLELMKINLDNQAKMVKYINYATQNSNRLTRLVGNLLDITKIDAGFLKTNFTNTDIVSLIRAICDSVEVYAKAKSIQLIFKTVLLKKVMPIDTEKIERIMLNLLSNAIKHTYQNGEIIVRVKGRKVGGVVILVEDTGGGIPKDKQGMIFDRFAQVNTELNRENEGSGIGLALVKSLVEILGGKITVKSELGIGSKFKVELPFIKMEADASLMDVYGFDLTKMAEMELSDLYLK